MSSSRPATAYTSGAKTFRLDTARIRKVRKEKEKKMNWFKRMIVRWVRDDWENVGRNGIAEPMHDTLTRDRYSDERITVRLEKAIGGHIVTVSKYNGKIDRHRENTYLIRDEDNLEESLTGVFISEKLSM